MALLRRTGAAAVAAVALAACGGSSSTPRATLDHFLAGWRTGDWAAMRAQVANPPADFRQLNTQTFATLGVNTAQFTAGRITRSKHTASAPVTERFVIPHVGTWTATTAIHLEDRKGTWRVAWTPSTINPAMRAGDRLLLGRNWPARAPILGAGGAPLVADKGLITVGVVGSRIKSYPTVRHDLLAAGAPTNQTDQALAQAKAHPGYFDPIFEISTGRFAHLKRQAGPDNVYNVPGTTFQKASSRSAITPNLAAHVVGTVGPITAEELKQLGAPYDASSKVGKTGLENLYERRLAGRPTIKIGIVDGQGATVSTLRTYPGRAGRPVATSLDATVQRAAERALGTLPKSKHAAMIAMRASTGQVLAVVSNPPDYAYDQALHGEFPPGSTFKVLVSSALIQKGLGPSSPASCPPSLVVNGETFHNAEGDQPTQSLDQAFTESCNTAFIALADRHLSGSDFPAAARLFGLQRTPQLGLPAFDASVPAPSGQTAMAASAIGQAEIVFSPLGMATMASAIDSGAARAPRLVTGAPDDRVAPTALPGAVRDGLRLMMGHVVQSGTAAGTGLPAGSEAKTGTAQYGQGGALKTDAWLMGYDGDIAFAVVVQDSHDVNGGPLDGPLIARFFTTLSAH